MKQAGPIIGMPFSLEGFAFFTEAIFLGVYLYGWDRISRACARACGRDGRRERRALRNFRRDRERVDEHTARVHARAMGSSRNIDPIAAMMTPAAFPQTLHMTLAAYAATGFAVAGIHAAMLLRDPRNAFHRRALAVALLVGAPGRAASSRSLETSRRATWRGSSRRSSPPWKDTSRRCAARRCSIGGIPNETRAAHEIRDRDSARALAARLPRARRRGEGARRLPAGRVASRGDRASRVRRRWSASARSWRSSSAAVLIMLWRKRDIITLRWLLIAVVLCAPMGFLCIEAGWTVTEVGPAALGHLRNSAHGRCGHADARPDRAVPHLHGALLLPRHHCRAAALPAGAAGARARTSACRSRRSAA